ncbi:MAG: hypothetical protein IPP90_00945 [Gemmatimonadaceae bacterium]|nr:hypothetical protein [Gemmatimonadaceae bacterium]
MTSPGEWPHAAARVVGIVQGREIDAPATLELEDHALVIGWTRAAPWRLALEGIDGLSQTASQLTLYLASGDVLDLTGDESLRALGGQLMDRACAMPELTRGLRALGSLRGTPGAAHDAWFAPLLSARRAIEGISDPLRQVTLMDASRLTESMSRVLAELAAVRAPTDIPQQRAIEAVLEEYAEPLFLALARMGLAADALSGSAPDTRLSDWRRWVDSVREVFASADESWKDAAVLLGS